MAIFGQNFAQKDGQVIDPTFFHTFFVKTCFLNLILPAERRRFFEKQQKTQKKTIKNNKKEMAKFLTYDGQVIDPTAYIYIALYIYIYVPLDPFAAYFF